MNLLLLKLLPLLALVQASEDCLASCPNSWKTLEDHCYLFVEDQDLTWDAAEAQCMEEGGHLASITSESIKDAVKDQMMKSVWTGAKRLPGKEWTWADGSVWSYEAWGQGEPKPSTESTPGGNCGKLDKIDDMEDRTCEGVARFVCTRSYCPGTSAGVIVGIVIGIVAAVVVLAGGVWFYLKR